MGASESTPILNEADTQWCHATRVLGAGGVSDEWARSAGKHTISLQYQEIEKHASAAAARVDVAQVAGLGALLATGSGAAAIAEHINSVTNLSIEAAMSSTTHLSTQYSQKEVPCQLKDVVAATAEPPFSNLTVPIVARVRVVAQSYVYDKKVDGKVVFLDKFFSNKHHIHTRILYKVTVPVRHSMSYARMASGFDTGRVPDINAVPDWKVLEEEGCWAQREKLLPNGSFVAVWERNQDPNAAPPADGAAPPATRLEVPLIDYMSGASEHFTQRTHAAEHLAAAAAILDEAGNPVSPARLALFQAKAATAHAAALNFLHAYHVHEEAVRKEAEAAQRAANNPTAQPALGAATDAVSAALVAMDASRETAAAARTDAEAVAL